ncbi:CsgE family curli-type amyloid fiber assembly protein [Moheibacter sp.]|uniref:CsgE family curli-type amyloid fiber assembly protein n=1 Tax=Moheibacter sp. TaxID=1965316 RepID=UPI003C77D6B1
MKTLLYTLIIFLLLFGINYGQEGNEVLIEAEIGIEQDENTITLQPIVKNLSSLHLEYNYLLLVKKTNKSQNISVNKQSGKFTIEPGEIKKLSVTRLSQSESQNIKAILYIRDELENKLITKDSIEIKPLSTTIIDETSLMLEGMVVDESKTKFGKDFYDNFFSVYNQYPKKFNFIILISELPYRGQTSIIQVKADHEIVYEFYTNPNEEYSKQQVSMALRQLLKFAEEKDNIKQEFNY